MDCTCSVVVVRLNLDGADSWCERAGSYMTPPTMAHCRYYKTPKASHWSAAIPQGAALSDVQLRALLTEAKHDKRSMYVLRKAIEAAVSGASGFVAVTLRRTTRGKKGKYDFNTGFGSKVKTGKKPKPEGTEKTCKDCGETKPIGEYYVHSGSKLGHHVPRCKKCHIAKYSRNRNRIPLASNVTSKQPERSAMGRATRGEIKRSGHRGSVTQTNSRRSKPSGA